MIYYWSLFGIITACALAWTVCRGHLARWSMFLIPFVLLLIFGGFRDHVGSDWEPYQLIFENVLVDFTPAHLGQEYGYGLLNYVIRTLSDSYHVFVFCVFAISLSLKSLPIRSYSPNVPLSFLVYFADVFMYFDTNALRQGLAIAMIFCSFYFVLKRQLMPFVLVVLAAGSMHVTALVVLPFYWASRLKWKKTTYSIIVLAVVLIRPNLVQVSQNAPVLAVILSEGQLARFVHYVGDDLYGRAVTSLAIAQRVVIFAVFLALYDKITLSEPLKRALLNAYFLSVVIFVVLGDSQEVAARLAYYYKAFDILIIPAFVTGGSGLASRLVIAGGGIAFCAIALVRILSPADVMLLPYANILMP